jgi:hypothetical protein
MMMRRMMMMRLNRELLLSMQIYDEESKPVEGIKTTVGEEGRITYSRE